MTISEEPSTLKGTEGDADAKSQATARKAGRGGMAVLGAKTFFLAVGFVQQPILKATLGLKDYGGFGLVLGVANIVNNVVVQSSTQGVSRAVSHAPGREDQALRATLRVHVPLAIVLTVLCIAAAPLIAWFEGDMRLTLPLIILCGVVLGYGLYAPLIGSLNGRSMFTRQAGLDVTFAVLRTVGLIGVGYAFVKIGASGIVGAALGFAIASACILPLALRWAGRGKAVVDPDIVKPRVYLRQLLQLTAALLFTNILMQVDLSLLGHFLSEHAVAAGADEDAAKRWAGVYKCCQLFAFLPFQLLASVTQILFPMIARAHGEGDREAVATYVRRGARLAAVACGLFLSVIVALPWSLLSFAFGDAAEGGVQVATNGETTLRILALAQGGFAMLAVATTVMNSIGRERTATIITAGAVVIVAAACAIAGATASSFEDMLVRTALGTGVALFVALLVAGVAVRRQTGAFIPGLTIVRVGAAVAMAVAGGLSLPHLGKLMAPLVAVGIAALYIVALVVTRELTGADVAMVKAMLGRKKKP